MNNYVNSFGEYSGNNYTDLSDLFSLNETNSAVKYGKEEFKKLFSAPLLESNGYVDDELLETAHAYYEFSMLSEAKSHWFESKGNLIYLDCDSHFILIKNGEGFVIERSTFELSQNINEGWDAISGVWNRLKKSASDTIKAQASAVKGAWDALSYGAKKAWEFVKTCANAVAEFVKGMTFVEWAALAMSVLSAILGICGGIAEGSGAFAWLGPILTSIAGILQAIGGGLHLYEGTMKYKNATKIVAADPSITPTTRMVATISQALPEYIIGTGMICLGAYDVTKSATTLISPAGGIESVTVGTTVKSSLKTVVKDVAKTGGAIHHFIEHAGLAIIKKGGFEIASKTGKAAVGKVLTSILSTVSSSILSSILGYIWEFALKAGESISKGIEYLLAIPSKISASISKFTKNSKGSTFFSIIAKGLNKLVKPLTDAASRVIAKYIQPTVSTVKEWFTAELKSYKESLEIIKEYKHELHTGIKHHEIKEPKEKGEAKNPLAPEEKIKVSNVKKKDVKIINKSMDKSKKVKEGLNYLKYFGDIE
jgi:hypothetical protein